ncbi:MAG TPA: hypothetical protein VFX58_03415 [Chitinophagaceae bacterium]|nr:hypothetical protein [Chitinophagaceae bacterium]
MSQELKENNRMDRIDRRLMKDGLTQFLGYRTFSDSLIHSSAIDSVVYPGVILPRTTHSQISYDRKAIFGNDSASCIIDYNTVTIYENTGSSLAGGIINLFRKNPQPEKEKEQTLLSKASTGEIHLSNFLDSISFNYLQQGGYLSGQLIAGADTFILVSVAKGKGMDSLQMTGYFQLMKGNTMYALFHRDSDFYFKKDRIFIYTKAKPWEQLLIAAYFGVIIS